MGKEKKGKGLGSLDQSTVRLREGRKNIKRRERDGKKRKGKYFRQKKNRFQKDQKSI